MLRVLFTTDYEIHGNGEGRPQDLMVDSTRRTLELFSEFGAKLTIMADVAEIERFVEYARDMGEDRFGSAAIAEQLRQAVRTGHDVQLHIHPSYYDAEWRDGRWVQDYGNYDLARLGFPRLEALIGRGKRFLEDLLRPVQPTYRCTVFRAANWSMQPSADIVRALVGQGIEVDTSVFKYGRRTGLVAFNYRHAWSDVVPWPASSTDVCERDPESPIFEIPIYCEHRWIGAFVSPGRLYRFIQSRRHRLGAGYTPAVGTRGGLGRRLGRLLGRHAWKMDFNQCSGRQLIGGLLRAEQKVRGSACVLPLVLIGHSKLFTKANAKALRPFLQFVAAHGDRFTFGRFSDIDLTAIRHAYHSGAAPLVPGVSPC